MLCQHNGSILGEYLSENNSILSNRAVGGECKLEQSLCSEIAFTD